MDKNEFLKQLEKHNILKFGDFTLASGAKSEFYIDLRVIPYNPRFFSEIMEQMTKTAMKETDFEIVCGIPMAAMSFATLIAYFSKKPLIFIRKEPKDHGLGKLIEGGDVKGKKVLVVDDLISSGFSKEFAINELRKEGAQVTTLAVIVDRRTQNNESKEWEQKNSVKVVSLFKLTSEEILAYRNIQKR